MLSQFELPVVSISAFWSALRCLNSSLQSCLRHHTPLLLQNVHLSHLDLESHMDQILENTCQWAKVHVLADHVIDFLEHQNEGKSVKRGLGFWSEQAGEQVHSDFERNVWIGQSFKREMSHPEYREKTKSALALYASSHLEAEG